MQVSIDKEGEVLKVDKNNSCLNISKGGTIFSFLEKLGVSSYDIDSYRRKLNEEMVLGVLFFIDDGRYVSILSEPFGKREICLKMKLFSKN